MIAAGAARIRLLVPGDCRKAVDVAYEGRSYQGAPMRQANYIRKTQDLAQARRRRPRR